MRTKAKFSQTFCKAKKKNIEALTNISEIQNRTMSKFSKTFYKAKMSTKSKFSQVFHKAKEKNIEGLTKCFAMSKRDIYRSDQSYYYYYYYYKSIRFGKTSRESPNNMSERLFHLAHVAMMYKTVLG